MNSLKIAVIASIIGILLFITGIFIEIKKEKIELNNRYEMLLENVKKENWNSAKSDLEFLKQKNYSYDTAIERTVYYHFYILDGDNEQKFTNYQNALESYRKAKNYGNSSDELEEKIKNASNLLKKQKEYLIKEKKEKKKKREEKEKRIAERNNRVRILSKKFGYTQFGEKAVVGRIKNGNNEALWIRADIDLYDNYGNLTGNTYTYQLVNAGQIWNFEAPTFGVYATQIEIKLTIDTQYE